VGRQEVSIRRTVSQNELRKTCNNHSNTSEEVVVGGETDESVRRKGALELAQREDGRCEWNEETEQTEQTRVG
jgi:hypothetical protein